MPILANDPNDMLAASANLCTSTFGSSEELLRISSMISGVVTSFGILDRSTSLVLVKPCLNLPNATVLSTPCILPLENSVYSAHETDFFSF